jgi:ribonuclease R
MKENLKIEKLILDLVLHRNYQPLKPKAIAKKLKLAGDEREVKRCLKRLIKKGRLMYGPKHLVMKAPVDANGKPKKPQTGNAGKHHKKKNELIGVFRKNHAGFGFFTPEDSIVTDRSEDIFIPKSKTFDAADQDVVRIRISDKRGGSRGKTSGRILEVIKRHTNRFVGTYKESNGLGIVTVDGGKFQSAVLVGDASAKNGRVGDKVVIEMVHFPSEYEPGEGVIVEVLGERGQAGVDTQSIIYQYGLPQEFPENVLDDAREQAQQFDEDNIDGRTDFTETTVVTIDPKTARDFDDAISLERIDNGHWELGVHIADVSHFVPYRSDLDTEAYARATSIYLPDQVIPMLPEIISNNLASLQPHRVRYSMTAIIEFTADGIPVHTELHRGAIKSDHRFTYEEIDDYLENDRPWKKKLSPNVFQLVRDMHTLAMTIRKRRMDGGAINLVLPEVKIDLDEDGKVAGAHTVDNTESHQVIEEFMLAANEAVARHLNDLKLPYMRRIHANPTEKKLQALTEFVRALGIECDSLQDRFELKQVVEDSAGRREAHAVHYAVLRAMQKAVYGPDEIGHYALNSTNYCHFTSPIRRYPDLIIHRMIGALIDGKKPDANIDRLALLGKHCSELEKRASSAERDLIKLKLLNFLANRVGKKMEAIITGVESFGVFVQGVEIPAEGIIPLESLPHDSYQYDRNTRTLSGHKAKNQFRLGDRIGVEVAHVDPDQRVLEFDLTSLRPPTPSRKKKATGSRTSGSEKRRSKDEPSRNSTRNSTGNSTRNSTRNSTTKDNSQTPSKRSTRSKPNTAGGSSKASKASGKTQSGKPNANSQSKRQKKKRR